MNVLVTGGAGFIASHIVDAYISAGHSVAIMDNLSTGVRENVHPGARFYQLDIRDAGKVEEIFRRERFDVVNHHAAQMDVRRSVADPMYDASVNIIGALSLLEACVKTGVARMVFASSGGAIYGEQESSPADEGHVTRPVSPYGVAKLATEEYLFYYKAVHNIQSVALRYGNIYGPRQNPAGEAGVIAIFTMRLLTGDQPIINSDGLQTRDYVFVGDVVQANLLALGCTRSEVFNIGTGIETTVNKLFDSLNAIIGSNAQRRHGPAKKGEQLRSVLNSARIAATLGWHPAVSLNEGLQKTVEYFRERGGAHGSSSRH